MRVTSETLLGSFTYSGWGGSIAFTSILVLDTSTRAEKASSFNIAFGVIVHALDLAVVYLVHDGWEEFVRSQGGAMAITRIVEWRMTVPPEKARELLTSAFEAVGLDPASNAQGVTGHSKARLSRNRWAADVTATITPHEKGSLAQLRIDMPMGTRHYAIADEIAQHIGENVIDDRGLKDAVDRLSKVSRLGGWMELRSLRHYLTATETVRELGQGIWGKDQAIVVLTDERLFLFDKKLVGSRLEEFRLDAITSVVTKRVPIGEDVQVTVAGNAFVIKRLMHGQGEAIARGFREAKLASQGGGSTPFPTQQSASKADELAKFVALHEQGILTDQEFAAMKAQILGV